MKGATILNARGGIKMQLRKEKRIFARMGFTVTVNFTPSVTP